MSCRSWPRSTTAPAYLTRTAAKRRGASLRVAHRVGDREPGHVILHGKARWDHLNLDEGTITVRRRKMGKDSTSVNSNIKIISRGDLAMGMFGIVKDKRPGVHR
jgi:hypothetical protein